MTRLVQQRSTRRSSTTASGPAWPHACGSGAARLVVSQTILLVVLITSGFSPTAVARQTQSTSSDASVNLQVLLNQGLAEQYSTEGYYTLEWNSSVVTDEWSFELQEARDSLFLSARPWYIGIDRATTISGRANGDYYYRVRLVDSAGESGSEWSNAHVVHVRHHALTRALVFLIIGGVVFLATMILVVAGHRRSLAQGGADVE